MGGRYEGWFPFLSRQVHRSVFHGSAASRIHLPAGESVLPTMTLSASCKVSWAHPQDEGKGFCAIISYKETIEIMDKVADEYHAEGIYYLCKHCPYLDDPHDKRVKRCACKYSSSGVAYKDSEACEIFYKALKRGDITPLPDYAR